MSVNLGELTSFVKLILGRDLSSLVLRPSSSGSRLNQYSAASRLARDDVRLCPHTPRPRVVMEFHPVILAGGQGSRMYPLTEDCPKALLPVGNMPLIWYPVQLLEKNGFKEAIVVVRESCSQQMTEVLEGFQSQQGVRLKFSLVEVPEQEDWGTADSLRALRGRVKCDLLVLSCDLVTSVPLHLLADFHRTRSSTLTALLVREEGDEGKKKGVLGTERAIIGLTEPSQLVYYAAQADLDEELIVSKELLRRHPHIRLHSQLEDAHLYLVKRWVLDYLAENRSISSVKGELLPHLVRHQSLEATPPTAPATSEGGSKQALHKAASSCVNELEQQAYQMSSFAGFHGNSAVFTSKLIRCHALVIKQQLCMRVNTVPAYTTINRLIPHHLTSFQLERAPPTRGKGVSSDCLVGSGAQLSEKVSVKHSCVGQHCSIGDKTKIINCILMDHVQVGEGCSLQGCIICSHVRVEDRVSLKDCQVGANFTVTKEADLRGETLVTGGGLHF